MMRACFALVLLSVLAAAPMTLMAQEESKTEPPPKPSVFDEQNQDPNNRRRGRAAGDGWFQVPDTNTQLRFGGFVQFNVIRDFQDTGFAFGDFIPSLIPIPTPDTPSTEFDARTSRATFETRTETEEVGSVSTMVSVDFAGSETEGSIQPRLRQAYVSWTGPRSNVSFTAGQAWTTFLDLGVWPDIFDLEGPNAMTGARQGLIRASYAFGQEKALVLDGAVEQPETAVQNGVGLRNWPDFITRLNWNKSWGHLQGAAVVRDLVAESVEGGGRDSAVGWGVSFSGSWLVPGTKRQNAPADNLGPRQDNVQFQLQTGSGIGRYVFDPGAAPMPQDAVYDEINGVLTPLDELGAFVTYRHWWSHRWRTQLVYGWVQMDNLPAGSPDGLANTTYALANLLYRPFPRMDVGVEYYWGERVNDDASRGSASRLLFGFNYGF